MKIEENIRNRDRKTIYFTIVKNGMPFVSFIYPVLRQLPFQWDWYVMDGTAAPMHCTKWCADIPPGVSTDGTRELIESIQRFDKRVHYTGRPLWYGKIEMVNYPMQFIAEPKTLLVEIDSDEFWTYKRLVHMRKMFSDQPWRNCAYFWCRYFVGRDLWITTKNCYGNHSEYEWHRAWIVNPGARFKTHEPPVLENFEPNPFTQDDSLKLTPTLLMFDHFAYASEDQVAFKEKYYGSESNPNGHLYRGAVENWKRLQANTQWPADLQTFLPWVGPGAVVDRLGQTLM